MRKLLLHIFGLLPKRPQGHPPFAFRDTEGLEYYSWADLSEVPPARMNEVEDIMLQIDAGMTRKTLESIGEAIAFHTQEAMAASAPKVKGNALAKVSFLATELLVRGRKIIPEECFFALAAVSAVRKDEDPYTFDKSIHQEKIEAFRSAGRAGHAFFTGTGPFRTTLNASLSTEEGLRALHLSWIEEKARNAAIWKSIRSPSAEGSVEKSSEVFSKTVVKGKQGSTQPSAVGQ